jgi:spermidine synthase
MQAPRCVLALWPPPPSRRCGGRGARAACRPRGGRACAIGAWTLLPSDFVLRGARRRAGDRVLTRSEGTTEVIAVVEAARGRALLTNGHAMSSTALLDQRYMRALAHVPLLSMAAPRRVLVIGFGVGNTAHAAVLHPSVERVEVAELSPHVLAQAPFFRDATGEVLRNPKVAVYINDGRQHLEMASSGVLRPGHARAAADRARRRGGAVLARVLPAGAVASHAGRVREPMAAGVSGAGESSLAMVRAFLDVFPAGGAAVGHAGRAAARRHRGPRLEIDPDGLRRRSTRAAVRADLARSRSRRSRARSSARSSVGARP